MPRGNDRQTLASHVAERGGAGDRIRSGDVQLGKLNTCSSKYLAVKDLGLQRTSVSTKSSTSPHEQAQPMLLQALMTLIRTLPPDERAALTALLAREDTEPRDGNRGEDSRMD